MLSLFNNKCYKAGNPKKLVIFIHGYNGSPEAIDYARQWLHAKLQDSVLIVPRAPFPCEKDVNNLQWLSFYEEDPQVRFRNPEASTEEIFDIFNRLGNSFAHVAEQMNQFISEQQSLYGIDDKNTFIMGFSQGAMISIYTALTRNKQLGGCISIAGIITGMSRLENEIVSRPPFLLLHGKADVTVQYKTYPLTVDWLEKHNIQPEKHTFEGLEHRMSEEEMQIVAEFINAR